MKFEVDIERLIDYGIPLNQYFLCQLVYQQEHKTLNFYMEQFDKFLTAKDFDSLVDKGYLGRHTDGKYVFSNYYITKKFIDIFVEKPVASKVVGEQVEDWIDDWYDLWPKGIRSGGYLVRSDKNGCITKMKKFVKNYPKFTKEIILKATSDYLSYYRMKNWAYVSLAHFFIIKDGVSRLASSCENILDKIEDGKIDLSMNETVEDDWTSDKL